MRQAIEDGRSCRADFKIIARAYERMGNALLKQGKVEEAIKCYQVLAPCSLLPAACGLLAAGFLCPQRLGASMSSQD